MNKFVMPFVLLPALSGCVGMQYHPTPGLIEPPMSAYAANKHCLPAANYPAWGSSFGAVGAVAMTQSDEWKAADGRYNACMLAKGWERG